MPPGWGQTSTYSMIAINQGMRRKRGRGGGRPAACFRSANRRESRTLDVEAGWRSGAQAAARPGTTRSRRYERDSTRNVHQLSGRGVSSGGGSPPPPGCRACTSGFCSFRIRVAQTWSSWAGSISRLSTTG